MSQLGYYICMPFAWLTRIFYTLTGSYGVALILFTLVVKLVLLPFQLKSKKSMLRMNRKNGKIKDIQTRFANKKERQQQEMADLYAREGINPMSGCLWSFLPLPILIALYNIIRYPLHYFMSIPKDTIEKISTLAQSLGFTSAAGTKQAAYEEIHLAKFIHDNWTSFEGKFDGLIDLNYEFLGMDLTVVAQEKFGEIMTGGWPIIGVMLLPIIATAIQFLMTQVSMKASSSEMTGTSRTMMIIMPLMTQWMRYNLPAALCVYWIAQSAFSVVQELTLNKYFNKILDREETDKERAKREARYAKYEKQKEMMAQQQARANGGNGARGTSTSKKKQQQYKASGEKKQPGTNENGRIGNRPYARGRAFSEDHYAD